MVTVEEEGGSGKKTHVSATDSLQQETGHLCLSIELCLGHPELLLGLRRVGLVSASEREAPPASLPSASSCPRGPPRGGLLPSMADVTSHPPQTSGLEP